MKTERLQEIVKLLKDENLTEITIWEGESRITVRQAGPVGAGSPAVDRPDARRPSSESPPKGLVVTAPLVGTFYRRPTPDSDPFVSPGDVVHPGDTVCIIEAMKVMNEIKAEVSGRVVAVLADDGAPVEYGQLLVQLEPA